MKKHSNLLVLTICMTLFGCSGEEDIQPLFGVPTPIPTDQTPIDVICSIQTEFKRLPKPLMARQSYQGQWTSRPIGAADVTHPGFVRIHLREEGLNFLQQHSRLELVASLAPLLQNQDLGGEVATLLAGIPAGNKSEQALLTRSLAAAIDQYGYSSPQQPGQWYHVDAFKFHYLNRFYGLLNTTSTIHRREVSDYKGSVEEALVNILEDYSKVTSLPLEGDQLFGPELHDDESVKQWIAQNGIPHLKPKPQAFINKYKGDKRQGIFAAMALLPTMPPPSTYMESTEYYMIWLLGLEEEYWPAVIAIPDGEAIPAKLRDKLRRKIVNTVSAVCLE